MASASVSRFAVLSIDDDGDVKKPQNTKKVEPTNAKKATSAPKEKEAASKKKKKKNDLAALAFAFGEGKKLPTVPKSSQPISPPVGECNNAQKKKNEPAPDFESWKQRDTELVNEVYERELEIALMESKADYEEKKELYDTYREEAEASKKGKGNKSKKPAAMSLDEFKNSVSTQGSTTEKPQAKTSRQKLLHQNGEAKDEQFFEKAKEEAKSAVKREQFLERQKNFEPQIADAARVAQLSEGLRVKDEENVALKLEIEKLKEDLLNVKTRNKRLCGILAQGEMRDIAEVLIQVERLQKVKDELTAEVDNLNAQLQQERSKVSALQSEMKKKAGGK